MNPVQWVETPGQIRRVAELAREIWMDHYVPIVGRAQIEFMLERFQSGEAIAGQIAEGVLYYSVSDGEGIRGYMALIPDPESGKVLLSKLYVHKSARGLGLGRAMLEEALRYCRENGMSSLWLTVNKHNAESIEWYERMGFENSGPIVQDIGGGFVMDDYRMERRP
jgi:ribosomal protein S18 acetylase RimI-like enzyme